MITNRKLFRENRIIKSFAYLLPTDTNSVSFQLIFVCEKECKIAEDKGRDLIFQIFLNYKLKDHLDRPDDYFMLFNA